MTFAHAGPHARGVAQTFIGTLQYAWFINDDETACVVRETYENSDAVLAHVGNLGELFGQLLEVGGGCEFEVFGNPSAELREATRSLDVSVRLLPGQVGE